VLLPAPLLLAAVLTSRLRVLVRGIGTGQSQHPGPEREADLQGHGGEEERLKLKPKKTKQTEPVSGQLMYYAIWWEGKTVQKNVGRKFWQKP
jgi:hypothetical protein